MESSGRGWLLSSHHRALLCGLSFVGGCGGRQLLRPQVAFLRTQAVPSASLMILQPPWTAASLGWPQPDWGNPSPSLSGLPKERRGRLDSGDTR